MVGVITVLCAGVIVADVHSESDAHSSLWNVVGLKSLLRSSEVEFVFQCLAECVTFKARIEELQAEIESATKTNTLSAVTKLSLVAPKTAVGF